MSEKKSAIREQLDRCVELYGNPLDDDRKKTVSIAVFEQLRADLLLVVGMAYALEEYGPTPPTKGTTP
jgi:hypothetical protein